MCSMLGTRSLVLSSCGSVGAVVSGGLLRGASGSGLDLSAAPTAAAGRGGAAAGASLSCRVDQKRNQLQHIGGPKVIGLV